MVVFLNLSVIEYCLHKELMVLATFFSSKGCWTNDFSTWTAVFNFDWRYPPCANGVICQAARFSEGNWTECRNDSVCNDHAVISRNLTGKHRIKTSCSRNDSMCRADLFLCQVQVASPCYVFVLFMLSYKSKIKSVLSHSSDNRQRSVDQTVLKPSAALNHIINNRILSTSLS